MQSTDPRSISAPELHRWLEAEGMPPRLIDVREDSELEVAPAHGHGDHYDLLTRLQFRGRPFEIAAAPLNGSHDDLSIGLQLVSGVNSQRELLKQG